MREMIQNELITPIEPMAVLERPCETLQPFLEYISRNSKFVDWHRERFYRIISQQGFLRRDAYIKIHI